jgi:aspartate racemase
MPLTLGLLGGLGPAATLDFLGKLQAATPARQDAHHIRVIADINPQLPDLHALGSGAGPAPTSWRSPATARTSMRT